MPSKGEGLGSLSKKIILAFTNKKEITYLSLQAVTIGASDREAREEVSFDHRLGILRERGYIEDFSRTSKDSRGIITAFRGYRLTTEGKSLLLRLQKEKNELERLRKSGKPLPKNTTGGDRWSKIKGNND